MWFVVLFLVFCFLSNLRGSHIDTSDTMESTHELLMTFAQTARGSQRFHRGSRVYKRVYNAAVTKSVHILGMLLFFQLICLVCGRKGSGVEGRSDCAVGGNYMNVNFRSIWNNVNTSLRNFLYQERDISIRLTRQKSSYQEKRK